MKGVVLNRQLNSKIGFATVPDPELKSGEALIRIKAAALNHRDEWCRQGLYPNLSDGVVLGSDGAGVVEKVKDEANSSWIGKEVIINPALFGDQIKMPSPGISRFWECQETGLWQSTWLFL